MNRSYKTILKNIVGTIAFSFFLWSSGAMAAHDERDVHGGRWMAGDFHNHTFLTDGSNAEADVISHAFGYGLDWIANSEHGGAYNRDPVGQTWPSGTEFLGNPPAGKMWRWQSLWQYSYPIITNARSTYDTNLIIQGYEWNVPTHEHASVAIVGRAEDGGRAIAQHEYLFDGSDNGTTSDGYLEVNGKTVVNSHEKAVAGVAWLERNYVKSSYFLINHPSRQQKYSIADIRDFNNAGPHVAFGFEGIPGHQKEPSRGGYGNGPFKDGSNNDVTFRARTYGGADYMIAKVGGLWDALLGEGRQFFTFVNSDFHNTDGDFWPGEYAKSYTFVGDEDHDGLYTVLELVDALRSGNSFAVHGDLINGLKFTAQCRDEKTGMGGTLEADKGCNLKITIAFKKPSLNNNGDHVSVDHIDLIAGEINGRVSKYLEDGSTPNPAYRKDTNETTKVIARFTASDWHHSDDSGEEQHQRSDDEGEWHTIVYHVDHVKHDMYFRLRGSNLGCGIAQETDDQCNPLIDDLMAPNSPAKAYADLWFYSNPIYVRIAH